MSLADISGRAPLYHAVRQKLPEVVDALLKRGANVNAFDGFDSNPISIAVTGDDGHVAIAKMLLENGADAGETRLGVPLVTLVCRGSGNVNLLSLLVAHGANLFATTQSGTTLLHDAAHSGHVSAFEFLLQRGLDPLQGDQDGNTPLHFAARADKVDVMKLVIEHNVDLCPLNAEDQTPILFAALHGSAAVVELLVSQEPRSMCSATDTSGATPLIAAARKGHDEVLSHLLKPDDAPLLAVDVYGHDVFHWAAQNGNPKILELVTPYAGAAGAAGVNALSR
jgi:ankyrin repeat protein